MQLIVLYGPPAAGKLTIARELSRRTGYRLLHNHQTFDLLEPVFGAYHPEFAPLLNRLRHDIIATAARSGFPGLIVTHVYGPEETTFVHGLRDVVAKHNGTSHFIRLAPHPDELARRVTHDSRGEFKKLRSADELRRLMDSWDVTQEIPGVAGLTIDNTHLAPEQVAAQLIRDLSLPETP